VRMVNWDPRGKTALSDDEVIYREVKSKLYYINYKIEGEEGFLTIATTRPETILGDTAICINPNDERHKHLKGKRAIVPLINRSVPIIEDEYVSMEFGTGCLKVTPAHDLNDYELGIKHNLESIDIFNDDGTLNEKAQLFIGEDRFIVRDKITKSLKEIGQLDKIEEYTNNVGFSERTDAVIEPKLSMQWFLKMDTITKPALKNVMDDTIQLLPAKFKNTYRHWMENVRDWCISRQLWWGQRIPAYYLPNGDFVVAENDEKALSLAKEKDPSLEMKDLRQDEDVLDTWFSSWLWPISVFDGFKNPDNEDINYYYPTNDLVTAPEILFFWVARMIIAGYEYRGDKPFKNVYLTGIVRDKQGRKMSKSLGNSPDPIELISQYGADGVRTGMLFSSPAGNDLLFDIKLCEQGRNFANKIWNAFRLVKSWEVSEEEFKHDGAVRWFESCFNNTLLEVEDHFSKFRISDALMSVYKLVWNDFCSWYLEMIKPAYQAPIDRHTLEKTIELLEKLMKLLHPFMPFISEDIWHNIREREEKDCLIVAPWPQGGSIEGKLLEEATTAFEIVSQVRNLRAAKQLSPREPLTVTYKAQGHEERNTLEEYIIKLGNLESFTPTDKTDDTPSFIVAGVEYFIPLGNLINLDEEREKLQKELDYVVGFKASIMKKLNNERFVSSAPEQVVENERKKLADAEH
ncbi:MAG: valine--tRNA ligase, partial [Cyclobacteriaceae bacterium]|nr:valine--tRNA ligase [Cyclobacteriaceae bacterium]